MNAQTEQLTPKSEQLSTGGGSSIAYPGASEPHYNPIFDKFVTSDDPAVTEMVAYSLYKIRKREWATDFYSRNSRKPNDEELKSYIRTWTPSLIEGTKREAANIVAVFADSVVQENAPAIRENALKGTFWSGVWKSIFASGLYTLILLGLVVIGQISGVDLVSVWRAVTGAH